MKRRPKYLISAVAVLTAFSMLAAGCSGGGGGETTAGSDEPAAEETSAAAEDYNSMSLDDIIAKAQEEGKVESVGMPDSWANWGATWADLEELYGIEHNDTDMSSAEELQMFKTEGEKGTKDIGDVGQGFAQQVIDEDLGLPYKTSYWDSVPDWAKGEDGKWMICYTGATCFLSNTDLIGEAPTSWEDIKNGDYKVSVGDITGGNAQAAIIASNFAMGGDLDNLDPAFEFWTEMAEAGRVNTLDILKQNFETGEVACGVVWSFTGVPYKNEIENYNMVATIPSDGAITSGYASVINKYAPHPHAAMLTREYILSDEGQANLAEAGAIPIRTDVEIPQEIQDATFQQADYANAIAMEDTDAYNAACATVVERWNEEILPLLVQ